MNTRDSIGLSDKTDELLNWDASIQQIFSI